MIVDRVHRDQLVEAIDGFLHEELTAFQFDDAIFEIRDQTTDETVKRVVDFLWHFYDDCDDHHVVLDRIDWNCFQRLRLLLKSDGALEFTRKRIWSAAQAFAAVTLAGFILAAYKTGIGQHLMIVAIPFGLVSIGLSLWRARVYRDAYDRNGDVSLYPFTSIAQLLWVGHSVRGFRKERYPKHLAKRRIRSGGSAVVMRLQVYLPWLLFSPAVLIAQLFPLSLPVRRVVP